MYASQHSIRAVPVKAEYGVDTEGMVPITGHGTSYIAVDYDASEDFIYYSEVNKDVIYRTHPNGTGMLVFISHFITEN